MSPILHVIKCNVKCNCVLNSKMVSLRCNAINTNKWLDPHISYCTISNTFIFSTWRKIVSILFSQHNLHKLYLEEDKSPYFYKKEPLSHWNSIGHNDNAKVTLGHSPLLLDKFEESEVAAGTTCLVTSSHEQ